MMIFCIPLRTLRLCESISTIKPLDSGLKHAGMTVISSRENVFD